MKPADWSAIKAGVPIASIIGSAVKLTRKGAISEGCCPFHSEKTPSFKVYDDHYHCFGCGAHGDVIDFITETQGVSVPEAIEQLGAGELKMTPQVERAVSERAADQTAKRAEAVVVANRRWAAAEPAPENHPYLVKKGIEPSVARLENANLLIPVYDKSGQIQSVQSISPKGDKLFQAHAPMKGGRLNIGIPIGLSIVCEGFATGASIFEAVPDRVCIAFSSAGVKDMARELVADGYKVAIAADNKALSDMIALGAELSVPVYVPPSQHDDFNDLSKAEGHAEVARVLRSAPVTPVANVEVAALEPCDAANDDDDPIDIWSHNAPPKLPMGLLPPLIERFAIIRAKMLGGDAGGLAMATLAVCAASIPDHVKVKVKQHEPWTEDPRLWIMLIGDPSSKKSPLMRAAASKLAKMDGEMLREHHAAIARWTSDKKESPGDEGDKPQERRLRIEDVTMESAQEVCRSSPDGVLALQDELSGWFGGIEKYAGGKGGAKDRSFWLRAYNGGEYAVNRIGRGSFLIDNLSVSILGGIQPDALRRITVDATEDGLIQRFMPVLLQSAAIGVDDKLPDVANEYEGLVESLRDSVTRAGMFGPMPVLFSAGAREIRARLETEHHGMVMTLERVNRKFAAHIGKFDGMFPRLCLIWHCIEHVNSAVLPDEISEDTAARVAKFLHSYILGHSKAFYLGLIGISEDQEQLEDVAGYILAHEVELVTMRTLQRGSRGMKSLTRQDGARLFEQLEALGWLEQVHKRSDAPSWKVNPRVFDMYREKANEEKQRRQEGAAYMTKVLKQQKAGDGR